MKTLASLLVVAACQSAPSTPAPAPVPAPAPLRAELLYSASGGYGVQPAGEDKGVLYAFVRLESERAMHVSIAKLEMTRDGATCAQPTKSPAIAVISPITKQTANRALTLDALAKGTPFDGALTAGTTFLRVQVEIDHACSGNTEPTVEVKLDDGTLLAQPLVERLPS
jgi:hypothetical protein